MVYPLVLKMLYFSNPKEINLCLRDDILKAVAKVIDSGHYILGEEVASFEKEFSEYLGLDYCVGVGTGTDALILALKSLDVGVGDEVIVPSQTAVATISAVCQVGATPIFADIEKNYYTIDPKKVEAAITSKTKAIIAVHLYGQVCDLAELVRISKSYKLSLIEDCAQATGSFYKNKHVGSFGDMGCFSFFPTKNLGAVGDGGAIATKRKDLKDKVIQLRQYGWDNEKNSIAVGMNSRLDELQAAILRVKLKSLEQSIETRNSIANFYHQFLQNFNDIKLPSVRPNSRHSFHLYVIQVKQRDRVVEELKKNGIFVGIHYKLPVHMMSAYKKFFSPITNLCKTEDLVGKIISLPIYPGFSQENGRRVVRMIEEAVAQLC